MCEAVVLSRRSRKNLYVPKVDNKSKFRLENQFFTQEQVEILNMLNAIQAKSHQNKPRATV